MMGVDAGYSTISPPRPTGYPSVMHLLAAVLGVVLVAGALWDAFETIVLPRRVSSGFRLTRLFYRVTWAPWRALARRFRNKRREAWLSYYGPLSLLMLLCIWAVMIIFAFGIMQWAAGPGLAFGGRAQGFAGDLYFSGTTFFTLGLGDVVPTGPWPRVLAVTEAGMGFAFLACVIGYLPVIYQAFSKREAAISLLDARAGSPPTAGELLWRQRNDHDRRGLTELLREWERWAAELLESHLSYPVLAYFRSQHINESWLSALAAILDSSSIVMVCIDGWCMRQAELTFAMARHAVVDLVQVFQIEPLMGTTDRLGPEAFEQLRNRLGAAGIPLRDHDTPHAQLAEVRSMYEPYIVALSEHLLLALPPFIRDTARADNWQSSPWGRVRLPGDGDPPPAAAEFGDDHF
jgi:Ion channel